jgi:hypothetical protein
MTFVFLFLQALVASIYPLICALPFVHLALLRILDSHNFVAIQQAKRVICLFQSPHGIDCAFPQLMLQIIAFHKPNAVFTRRRALELNGALDHIVDDVFRLFILCLLVVQYNSWKPC